jgi:hypothetical protein
MAVDLGAGGVQRLQGRAAELELPTGLQRDALPVELHADDVLPCTPVWTQHPSLLWVPAYASVAGVSSHNLKGSESGRHKPRLAGWLARLLRGALRDNRGLSLPRMPVVVVLNRSALLGQGLTLHDGLPVEALAQPVEQALNLRIARRLQRAQLVHQLLVLRADAASAPPRQHPLRCRVSIACVGNCNAMRWQRLYAARGRSVCGMWRSTNAATRRHSAFRVNWEGALLRAASDDGRIAGSLDDHTCQHLVGHRVGSARGATSSKSFETPP